MVIMMMVLKISTVTFVPKNVKLVLEPTTIVLNVLSTELTLHIVLVWTVWLNKELSVLLVTTHVKPVPSLQTIVTNVLKEENLLQNVLAHSDNTKTPTTEIVNNVTSHVNLVLLPLSVLFVEETELENQNVPAHLVTSKPMKIFAQDVHTNVSLVNTLKITVLNVPKTESMNQFVTVLKDTITLMNLLTVQLVTKNVNLVFLPPTTVSLVLKD